MCRGGSCTSSPALWFLLCCQPDFVVLDSATATATTVLHPVWWRDDKSLGISCTIVFESSNAARQWSKHHREPRTLLHVLLSLMYPTNRGRGLWARERSGGQEKITRGTSHSEEHPTVVCCKINYLALCYTERWGWDLIGQHFTTWVYRCKYSRNTLSTDPQWSRTPCGHTE